jgi:hypothetical protein
MTWKTANLCSQEKGFASPKKKKQSQSHHFAALLPRTWTRKKEEGILMPASGFSCDFCSKTLRSPSALNGHIHDHHTKQGIINLPSGMIHIVERNEAGMFLCECEGCNHIFPTKSGVRSHLLQKSPECLSTILSNRQNKSCDSSVNITSAKAPTTWRHFNEALLQASGEIHTSEASQQKALFYADQFDRLPIGFSMDGNEQNALVTRNLYSSLPDQPFIAIINKSNAESDKRPPWEVQRCLTCNPPLIPLIGDILGNSPLSGVLGMRNYKEVSNSTRKRLDLNWLRFPQARQIVSHLLSGAIIYNTKNEYAVLINEVEIYGRSRLIDCHREQTGVVKGIPIATSMPSTSGMDVYKGVHPVTISNKDCKRLVIGMHTCDALVTSCIRLDVHGKGLVSIGGDTHIFEIKEQDSSRIRIFLDAERIKMSKKMVKKSVNDITKNMGVEYLRQVRTKFGWRCRIQ